MWFRLCGGVSRGAGGGGTAFSGDCGIVAAGGAVDVVHAPRVGGHGVLGARIVLGRLDEATELLVVDLKRFVGNKQDRYILFRSGAVLHY